MKAFEQINQGEAEAGMVHGLNPTKETHLKMYASMKAINAVIKQQKEHGEMVLVVYASKSLTEYEKTTPALRENCEHYSGP